MLVLLSAHGGLGLRVRASGDTEVDDHHLAEDLGISLGQALARALGNRRGIRRYGFAVVPMDEALVMSVVDISGRSHLSYGLKPGARRIKDFDTDLVEEFLLGLVRNVPMTVHLVQMSGRNAHHVIEAGFKALGRALGDAVAPDPRFKGVPSTKGRL
jgi:imidazoleglycerol-phosphate dehydratase